MNEIRSAKNIFLKIVIDNYNLDSAQHAAFERFVKTFDDMFNAILDNAEAMEIATIANECRTAQRAFFATKSSKHLSDAKILEIELDMKIQEVLNHARVDKRPTVVQALLFHEYLHNDNIKIIP